jgi:hypothetical protein
MTRKRVSVGKRTMMVNELTVSKPVTGCSNRSLLRTSTEREALADNDPSHGTPSTGERSDEHAGADDEDDTDSLALLGVNGSTDGGEDSEPTSLPEGTDE